MKYLKSLCERGRVVVVADTVLHGLAVADHGERSEHVVRVQRAYARNYLVKDNGPCFFNFELSTFDKVREVRVEEGQRSKHFV